MLVWGTSVGRLLVCTSQEEVRVLVVALLREHRGHGIGSHVVRGVCEQAAELALPVRLSVLRHNPARRLYLRLGFRSTGPATNLEAYDELEWTV